MTRVSAIVICVNEEPKLGRCLASLSWVDELIVVDSGSTDRSVAIARAHGAIVHERPWPGYVEQKRFAFAQAAGEWVVSLDADEEMEPALIGEIQDALSAAGPEIDGFVMPRRAHYLGRWIGHGEWYPDDKLRVFRRTRAACVGEDVHERFIVPGRTVRLAGHILHYSCDGIEDHVWKADRYSTLLAASRHRGGERFSVGALLWQPVRRFLRGYVRARGFRDGVHGLLIAAMAAFYVFLTHAKLLQLELARDRERWPPPPP